MNQGFPEEDVKDWYTSLNADHERLRRDLLMRLPDLYGTNTNRGSTRRHRSLSWKQVVVWSSALSAMLLFGLTVSHVGTLSRSAKAVELAVNRLRRATSIELDGWVYDSVDEGTSSDERYAYRAYVERPHTYWIGQSPLDDRSDGVYFKGSDGQSLIRVSPDAEIVEVRRDRWQYAAMVVEEFMQFTMLNQILVASAEPFAIEDQDRLADGTEAIVLRARFHDPSGRRVLKELWLNKNDFTPLRLVVQFGPQGTAQARKVLEIDRIVLDGTKPEWVHLGAEDLPASTAAPESSSFVPSLAREASAGSTRVSLLPAIWLDEEHVFVGRCLETAESEIASEFVVATPGGAGLTTKAQVIGQSINNEDDTRWAWCVLTVNGRLKQRSRSALRLTVNSTNGTSTVTVPILHLSPNLQSDVLNAFSLDTTSIAGISPESFSMTGLQRALSQP